jgi:hypothetical protein
VRSSTLGTDDTCECGWSCVYLSVFLRICVCVCVACGWVRSSTLGTDDTAGVWGVGGCGWVIMHSHSPLACIPPVVRLAAPQTLVQAPGQNQWTVTAMGALGLRGHASSILLMRRD